MTLLSFLINLIEPFFTLIAWRDIVEIFFLTFIISFFMQWLASDQQKSLVGYFYSYCCITMSAYYLDLYSISTLLFFGFPLFIIILCILHQTTLQKNFITLKKIDAPTIKKNFWINELVRSCIHAMHHNKNIVCIIEKSDSLIDFLIIPYFFNADITTELLTMLINTNQENPCIFLIDSKGTLIAFNIRLQNTLDNISFSDTFQLSLLEQQLFIISQKTDALILFSKIHPLFEVYLHGTHIHSLTSNQLLLFLPKYLVPFTKKGNNNEPYLPPTPSTSQEHHIR